MRIDRGKKNDSSLITFAFTSLIYKYTPIFEFVQVEKKKPLDDQSKGF